MFEDGVVKYLYIANELKKKIKDGDYKFGETIPSENELTQLYDVSRHTIREAVSLLVKEKFVRKEKGSGTYVSYNKNTYKGSSDRPLTVGVISTYMSDYIFPSIIRGIEKELNKNNIGLLISSTHNNFADEEKALLKMMDNKVDGMIIEPTKSSLFNPNINLYLELNAKGIPFVMINSTYGEFDSNFVVVDDVNSGFIATEYLIKRGHTDILAIMKSDDRQGKDRLKGFVKAHAKHKLSFKSDNIITYVTEEKDNFVGIFEKINFDLYSAVVCYNDEVASRLSMYLRENGYLVPEDISIMSHDDSILSYHATPPITSLTHPKEELGVQAAKWIASAVKGEKTEPIQKLFTTQIIEKESVKAIVQSEID